MPPGVHRRLGSSGAGPTTKACRSLKPRHALLTAATLLVGCATSTPTYTPIATTPANPSKRPVARAPQAPTPGWPASYAEQVRNRIFPNIAFEGDIAGNPAAVVELLLGPDGSVIWRRFTKSSGIAAWDQAVLRAIDQSEPIPVLADPQKRQFRITFYPKE